MDAKRRKRYIGMGRNSPLLPSIYTLLLLLAYSGILPPLPPIPSLMVACSPVPPGDEEATVPLTRSIPWAADEGLSLQRADVFFFFADSTSRLDAYERIEHPGNPFFASSTLGKRYCATVANAGIDRYDWASIQSLPSLQSYRVYLQDEDPEHPLMTGLGEVDASPLVRAAIPLSPLLCQIRLHSLCCDFHDKPYAGQSLERVRAYLINLAASSPLFPDADCLPTDFLPETGEMEALPFIAPVEIGQVGEASVFPQHSFYCYPNPATEEGLGHPFTRLVIAGELNGHSYYYPISLPGLVRGQCLSLDICLTRTGTSDPDIPLERDAAQCTFRLEPWQDFEPQSIRF